MTICMNPKCKKELGSSFLVVQGLRFCEKKCVVEFFKPGGGRVTLREERYTS
ncbi:MAG: hypothetical protein ACYCQJ_12875 [Nitrososphaerales archaeon]